MLSASSADSSYRIYEAESGGVYSLDLVVSDNSASGGNAIVFTKHFSVALQMPTIMTVGLRCTPNETISATESLIRLRSAGRLSCVIVLGQFTLKGSDGVNWIIEDVIFRPGGSLYGINGYRGVGGVDPFTGTQAQRPVLRYIEVLGAAATGDGTCSTTLIGKDMIIEHANLTGCQDGIKADSRLEVRHSWVHDLDQPTGTHSDGVQIVSGTDIVFEGNRFDAYSTYSSDGSLPAGTWDYASGMLQTGSVSGDISATWTHNWFAGGRYTIRGVDSSPYLYNYVFRDNPFLRFGTSVALGLTNMPPYQYGSTGTLGTADFDCSNVWDDTEMSIKAGC